MLETCLANAYWIMLYTCIFVLLIHSCMSQTLSDNAGHLMYTSMTWHLLVPGNTRIRGTRVMHVAPVTCHFQVVHLYWTHGLHVLTPTDPGEHWFKKDQGHVSVTPVTDGYGTAHRCMSWLPLVQSIVMWKMYHTGHFYTCALHTCISWPPLA